MRSLQGNADGNDGDKDSVVARTFLIRLKTEEDRDKLATIIQEYAPKPENEDGILSQPCPSVTL